MLKYPVELFLPNMDVPFAKNGEQSEVLDEGIGKFYVASVFLARYPKGKNGPNAVWLRFERIGIESRSIVPGLKFVQP